MYNQLFSKAQEIIIFLKILRLIKMMELKLKLMRLMNKILMNNNNYYKNNNN